MNISPTHVKILTASAPTLAEAAGVLEASFLAWSKDNPGFVIMNVQQNMGIERESYLPTYPSEETGDQRPIEQVSTPIECTMTLTVIYGITNQAAMVSALTFATEAVVNAWRNYLAYEQRARESGGDDPKAVDIRVALFAPLAQLNMEYARVREW